GSFIQAGEPVGGAGGVSRIDDDNVVETFHHGANGVEFGVPDHFHQLGILIGDQRREAVVALVAGVEGQVALAGVFGLEVGQLLEQVADGGARSVGVGPDAQGTHGFVVVPHQGV